MEDKKDVPIPDNSVIVDKPVIVKDAKVEFMTKAAFKSSPPRNVQNYIKGILYFCGGLPTVLVASQLFTTFQLKVIGLILSLTVLGCGAIEITVGVKSNNNEKR